MSDTVILQKKEELPEEVNAVEIIPEQEESNLPTMAELQTQLAESSKLVDDIVLKKYLHKLTHLEIIPLTDELKQISDIRLFKITEMVYQKDEYSTYKFASVFNSVQNLNCGVFIVADSNGEKTDFYMGVRSLDDKRTTKSLKDTLRNALIGQFPGVKYTDLLDPQAEAFLADIPTKSLLPSLYMTIISVTSCQLIHATVLQLAQIILLLLSDLQTKTANIQSSL